MPSKSYGKGYMARDCEGNLAASTSDNISLSFPDFKDEVRAPHSDGSCRCRATRHPHRDLADQPGPSRTAHGAAQDGSLHSSLTGLGVEGEAVYHQC